MTLAGMTEGRNVIRVARAAKLALPLTAALLAAACQSDRFAGRPPVAQPVYGGGRQVAAAPADDAEPIGVPGPTARVDASPLPPAPGTTVAPVAPGAGPGGVTIVEPPQPGAPVVAGLGTTPTAAPPAPAAPPASRSSAIGKWTAREAAGSCAVTLSSTPSLDLYRANTSGCANKDLQAVNAWEFRDGEVYLYARGGVVARLRDQGGGFSGVLAKSGAPLSLSK